MLRVLPIIPVVPIMLDYALEKYSKIHENTKLMVINYNTASHIELY